MALQSADVGDVRQGGWFGWGERTRKIDMGFGHVNFAVLEGCSNQSVQLLNTFPSYFAEASRNHVTRVYITHCS